jgi:hypothetical protein
VFKQSEADDRLLTFKISVENVGALNDDCAPTTSLPATMTGFAMLTTLLLVGFAALAQAQQTSCNLNRLVAPLNAACCPRPGACSAGIPKVCTAACREAWDDFSSSTCRAELLGTTGTDATSQRLAAIFDAVSALCEESGDRPADQTGTCPRLAAPVGTTGECRDLNMGATCEFACDPADGQSGHRRAQAGITDSVATFRCSHGDNGPEWTQLADCTGGATAVAVGLDPE